MADHPISHCKEGTASCSSLHPSASVTETECGGRLSRGSFSGEVGVMVDFVIMSIPLHPESWFGGECVCRAQEIDVDARLGQFLLRTHAIKRIEIGLQ